MIANPTRLYRELQAARVPAYGCDSTGRIDFRHEATEEHRALAAAILAAHDPNPTYAELRAKEYPSPDALIVALWELVIENRPEAADALEIVRQEVKQKYPKPAGA